MDREQFGRRLSQLRNRRGMNQKELADALSVSVSAVSKWEHGNNFPDLSIICRLAEILQVSCDDLLSLEQEPGQLPVLEIPKGQEGRTEIQPRSEDNAGEKQRLRRKKRLGIVAAGTVLLFLCCAAGYYVLAGHSGRETGSLGYPQQVAARYIEDVDYGKMYEIAFVMEDVDLAFMQIHLEGLKASLEQELEEDTQGIRASYYENTKDAEAWEITEVVGDIFLNSQ